MPANTVFAFLLAVLLVVIAAATSYAALNPVHRGAIDAAALNLASLLAAALTARVRHTETAPAITAGRHRATADERWAALGPWPTRLTPADDHDSTWARHG